MKHTEYTGSSVWRGYNKRNPAGKAAQPWERVGRPASASKGGAAQHTSAGHTPDARHRPVLAEADAPIPQSCPQAHHSCTQNVPASGATHVNPH